MNATPAPTLATDCEYLWAHLSTHGPKDAEQIRRSLKWGEKRFKAARQALLDDKKIAYRSDIYGDVMKGK